MQYTKKQRREKSLKKIQELEKTLEENNYNPDSVEKILFEESVIADPAARFVLSKSIVLSSLIFQKLQKKQQEGLELSGDELRGVGQMMNQTRKNLEALGLFEVVKKKPKLTNKYFSNHDEDDDDADGADDEE